MENKRRTTNRSTYEVQVAILYKDNCLEGKSVDISAGGMFILCNSFPKIGAEITIEIGLPSIPKASIPAFVRWSNPSGFGVQFAPIGVKATHAINKICSACGK